MTDREKAIITAYTGYVMLTGDKLGIFYRYIEELLGYMPYTHELADKKLIEKIHDLSKDDFIKLCKDEILSYGEKNEGN